MFEATETSEVGNALAERSIDEPSIATIRFGVEARPPLGQLILYAVQHVVVMFTAMITPPLVIGQLLGLPTETRVSMLSGVMLGCGLGTLVSTLGLFGFGARLPLLLGAYAVYIGPVVAIAKTQGLPAAVGGMLVGALFLVALSPFVGVVRRLFPPLVVGILLIVTGLSLIRIAINVSLAVGTPYQGQPATFLFLIGSVVVIAVVSSIRGPARTFAVLVTVVAAYLVALISGYANISGLASAPLITIPSVLPFSIAWPDPASLSTILIYNVVAAIYTMSITIALCDMLKTAAPAGRLRSAVAGDGLGSLLSVIFGGLPLISYDQNVGAISLTGVGSRFVVAVAGGLIAIMAFVPKFAAIFTAVPPFIFGGTLLFMFGMIVAIGIKILSGNMTSQRELVIVAGSAAIAAATNLAPPAVFDAFSPAIRILASDGIITGLVTAIVLNIALPSTRHGDRQPDSIPPTMRST